MPLSAAGTAGAEAVLDHETAELIARCVPHPAVRRAAAAWLAAYRAACARGSNERAACAAGDAAWDRSAAPSVGRVIATAPAAKPADVPTND